MKNADLEVLNPLLDRPLNEWLRTLPDEVTVGKRYVLQSLRRLYPDLAAIPYAKASNLPSWPQRWSRDPAVTSFFHDLCSHPGWLDEIGASERVLNAIDRIAPDPARPRPTPGRAPGGRADRSRGRGSAMLASLGRSRPGRLFAEVTLEARATGRNTPMYLRIARLSVLHWMLGEIARRRNVSIEAARPWILVEDGD